MAGIEVKDLSRAGDPGIDDVALHVDDGEVVGLLGPPGAGKTALMRTIAGLWRPDGGRVRLAGLDIHDRRDRIEATAWLGYAPQRTELPGELTGHELMEHFARSRGQAGWTTVRARFEARLDLRIRHLEPPERRKLVIMQAFQHAPDVVLLDEPTAGLDRAALDGLGEIVEDRRDAGASVLWATSDLDVVRAICDRVAVMRRGRIVATEPVETVERRCGKVVEAWFQEQLTGELLERLRFPGVVAVYGIHDEGIRMIVRDNIPTLIERLEEMGVLDLNARDTTVQDLYDHFWDPDAPKPLAAPGEPMGGTIRV